MNFRKLFSLFRVASEPIFFSGQIGVVNKVLAYPDFQGQFLAAMGNVETLLEKAGLEPENLVDVTVILSDMKYFDELNCLYEKVFEGRKKIPTRTCFAVSGLPFGALVELKAIASRL